MASVDKFGAAFAIGFMAVMLGIMGAISSDTVTSDRPGAEQQAAVSPPPMPKPSPERYNDDGVVYLEDLDPDDYIIWIEIDVDK